MQEKLARKWGTEKDQLLEDLRIERKARTAAQLAGTLSSVTIQTLNITVEGLKKEVSRVRCRSYTC